MGIFGAVIHFGLCWLNDRDCFETQKEGNDTICITVTIVENDKNSLQLDTVRGVIIPFLLGTIIKGW